MNEHGTDPTNADTDGDGLKDGEEVRLGTNPLRADTDFDGLSDGAELRLGTDPRQPDTDGDGLTDGWEHESGYDPTVDNNTDADPDNDADADPDGDGLTNGEENDYGTDPNNPDTDGDGVPDGFEIKQSSDSNDATDFGKAHSRVQVSFYFGDHSGSHSEKYCLNIIPIQNSGARTIPKAQSYVNANYGTCEMKVVALVPGWKYNITLSHAGTNLPGSPDYDYTLTCLPREGILFSGTNGFFGVHENIGNVFSASDKVANVSVVKPIFKSGGRVVNNDGYVYISERPQMPDMQLSFNPPDLLGNASVSCTIEYSRYPAHQVTRYPSSSAETIRANGSWNITSLFGSDFRGGRAIVVSSYAGASYTNVVHIRGNNPPVADVETALGTSPWYVKGIAKRESGQQGGRYYCQFNEVGNLGPNWSDICKTPNFGQPNGWGIFQIDPPINCETLWNWRTNIAQGKTMIEQCIREATAWIESQVRQQMTEDPNQPLAAQVFKIGGVSFQQGTSRTPIDACAIQRYNGAARWVIYWQNKTSTSSGRWRVRQASTTYIKNVLQLIE